MLVVCCDVDAEPARTMVTLLSPPPDEFVTRPEMTMLPVTAPSISVTSSAGGVAPHPAYADAKTRESIVHWDRVIFGPPSRDGNGGGSFRSYRNFRAATVRPTERGAKRGISWASGLPRHTASPQ